MKAAHFGGNSEVTDVTFEKTISIEGGVWS